ncbi:MAG TPA: ABC transporter permease [Anaerolineaceae bacterium]|nr:ABC transporter permease [Anaerolineaceae bacterium]
MNLKSIKDIFRYPTVVVGVAIIAFMFAISILTVIAIPYDKAVSLWRGSEADWYRNPKTAAPVWYNWFRQDKLPETIDLTSDNSAVTRTVKDAGAGRSITYIMPIKFIYDGYPDDMTLYFTSTFDQKAPFIGLSWIGPDGKETRLTNFAIDTRYTYRFNQDTKVTRKLGGQVASKALFSDIKNKNFTTPVKGDYRLKIEAVTFDKTADVKSELVVYGQLAGWAGTDHLRRDLGIALLWGTPVALLFGLLAAVGTTLAQLIIAAISAWFGGWVDVLLQRITEVNLVLPFLPILMMIGTFYSRSIFVILSAVILLSIFGQGIKTFRAVLLQVKESAYIEAARSYGASSWRIIFSYMIPRLIPMLIPQFIVLVPSYVFLEASLAILGLGDPTLPTWGKIIEDSESQGALYQGWYYWVLEPSVLLMITGLAFSVVGYALDRVFNPRLRGQ